MKELTKFFLEDESPTLTKEKLDSQLNELIKQQRVYNIYQSECEPE